MIVHKDALVLAVFGAAAVTSTTAPILPPELALHWYCLGGALLGGIGMSSIRFKGMVVLAWHQMIWRLLSCGAAGFGFAPFLIRWLKLGADPETVMGISAGVGVAVWIIGLLAATVTAQELADDIKSGVRKRILGKGGGDGRP